MSKDNELDKRLSKADPAKARKAPKLPVAIIAKASATEPNLTLRDRFELLGQNARRIALGAAVSGSAAVVAIALVVSATPTPIIQLSGQQGTRNNESQVAASDDAGKMYMPYLNFEYVAGPGLSSETGSGQVYKLVRQSSPEEVLANVAEIFGVEGDIKKYPDFNQDSPGYFLGKSTDPWGYDGENPVISLWWSGTASWNYSNPIAYPASECKETDKDGNCSSWTEFQPTPELLPSREQALAKALEVFNGTGLAVSESDIRIDSSEWGVNAYASLYVDGQPTNIEWYLGWSSTGEISYAGGHSVIPEAVGTFETISQLDAVDRLADWRWSGSPSGLFYEKYQPIVWGNDSAVLRGGEESGVSEGDAGTGTAPEPAAEPSEVASDEPMVEPAPDQSLEPMPEPETVTLTIEQAESALLSVWDANGDVWLVPGYIMVNDQGWFGAVIALIEGVIELPKETELDIMPLPADDSGISTK